MSSLQYVNSMMSMVRGGEGRKGVMSQGKFLKHKEYQGRVGLNILSKKRNTSMTETKRGWCYVGWLGELGEWRL